MASKHDEAKKDDDIKQRDKDIEIAKITAFQASIVALIGASAGIITTLIGTGTLSPSSTSNNETVQSRSSGTDKSEVSAQVTFENYGVGSIWAEIPNDLQKCVESAKTALEDSDFDTKVNQASVWGFSEEYTASFRCIPEKEIAIIIMGGPNSDERRGKIERIADRFMLSEGPNP